MMRAALIKDGTVANVIVVDPEQGFELPGFETVLLEKGETNAEPGSTFDGKAFARPVPAEESKEKGLLRQLLDALASPKDSDEQAAASQLKESLAVEAKSATLTDAQADPVSRV